VKSSGESRLHKTLDRKVFVFSVQCYKSPAFVRTIILFLSVLVLPLIASCQWLVQPKEYNVILISVDTLRADHLSCYGYFRETSPTIDKFAEYALQYSNAFSSSPSTLPSHMSMFTSLHPTAHGLMPREDFIPLSGKLKTLTEILRANGYDTYGYYDGGFLDPKYGFGRGFISYKNRTNALVYRAIDLIKDKPAFLFIHYFDVHSSRLDSSEFVYDGPPEFRDRYTQSRLNHDPSDVFSGRVTLTDEELEQVTARYDGGILHVDSQLEELFDLLKKKNLFDNALIIITSDHGESLGFKGMMNKHGWLYDVGLHVPLLMKLPKDYKSPGPAKGKIDYLVRTTDIMPTILEVLSIDPPPYIEGSSLLGVTEDRIGYARFLTCYSVRTPSSRLLFYARPDFDNKVDIEVYDLKNDPGESTNLHGRGDLKLINELMPLAGQLEARAESLREEFEDSTLTVQSLDDEAIEDLKALGYLQN
jgi:arylsulfatase A-like enzyme